MVGEITDLFPSDPDPITHSDLSRWNLTELIDDMQWEVTHGSLDYDARTVALLGLRALVDVERELEARPADERAAFEKVLGQFKIGMEARFVVLFAASQLRRQAAEGYMLPTKSAATDEAKVGALERKREALDAEFADPKNSGATDNDWANARASEYGLAPDKVRARLRGRFGPVRQRPADWRVTHTLDRISR